MLRWRAKQEDCMKTKFLFASAAALALAACSQSEGPETGVGNSAAATAVEDTASQATGAVTAPMANGVEAFVTNAAIGDMYEIESSKLALEKSKNADIKAFANMMIKDHTTTTSKLKATLASANVKVTPPTDLDDRRRGMIENLRAAAPDAFDKAYLDQQTAAHSETLTLMKSYADDGDVPALKKLAADTAPIVQHHYDHVQKLDNGGADGTK
jgi:putative membrane protein